MHIGIIGAGHAGVEAARAAAKAGAEVTLFSAENIPPYYRPRLPALAFGQAEFSSIRMHPPEWYAQQNIKLLLNAQVESFDATSLEVKTKEHTQKLDGLVIASGAGPLLPPFASDSTVTPLWTVAHANAIRSKVKPDAGIVIIGGGILGIEAALRAAQAKMKVTVLEQGEWLMSSQFCTRASDMLRHNLTDRGIKVMLRCSIKSASSLPGARSGIELDNGRKLETDICLVCTGACAEKKLSVSAGLKAERGILVDQSLLTSARNVFAAGDVIQFRGITRSSALAAAQQGNVAGTNSVNHLNGEPLRAYQPDPLPLSFKAVNFELYALGLPCAAGYEEKVLDGSTDSVIRVLISKGGIPTGIQMVGTREGFDHYFQLIKASQAAIL